MRRRAPEILAPGRHPTPPRRLDLCRGQGGDRVGARVSRP